MKSLLVSFLCFMALNAFPQSFIYSGVDPFGVNFIPQYPAPAFVDIDGDGDFDLFIGDEVGHLSFYEINGTTTNPVFGYVQYEPFGLEFIPQYANPTFVDIDGDGDFDLFIGDEVGHLSFYENIGTATFPSFGYVQYEPFGLAFIPQYATPTFVDIDGDGDFDLFIGEEVGHLSFYENIGTKTNPSFGYVQYEPFGLAFIPQYAAPAFADVDNDGDFDLLVGDQIGHLSYYENIGTKTNPSFGSVQYEPFGLIPVGDYAKPAFVDFNSDTDKDLIVGERVGHLEYFENTTYNGIGIHGKNRISIGPNPTNGIFVVNSEMKINQITVSNIDGKDLVTTSSRVIDLSGKSPGIYFVRIETGSGNYMRKVVLDQSIRNSQ